MLYGKHSKSHMYYHALEKYTVKERDCYTTLGQVRQKIVTFFLLGTWLVLRNRLVKRLSPPLALLVMEGRNLPALGFENLNLME